MQVPLICSYLFNAHDIHFAPTLKKNCVLRLEPPLTLTMSEVQAIVEAIGAACALIERHGCGGLIDFVLNRMEVPNAA
jgi:acetylornithine/succinyldiaminopimelate/putrescine aminotransferase